MPSPVRPGLFVVFLAHFFFTLGATLHAQESGEADRIAQTASRAEEAGEYELAAGQWEKLITQFPDATRIGAACYHSGYCHIQIEQYDKAIARLEQAIKKLDPAKKNSIAQSYLFLGFAESKLGRQLAQQDPESSNQLLTTATQTFATLLKQFPDFTDLDQALFFQGEAFESLDRLDNAAETYEKMLELSEPEFKLDGLFALAFIRARQGKYDQANQLYTRFEAEGSKHPSFNEVRFRSAEVLMELARAAENLGEQQRMQTLLEAASRKFAAVYDSRDPEWSDQARFQQANCMQRLGQYEQSARLYESVVQIPNSKLADRARVYAGRDYLRAGKGETAQAILDKAVAVPSSWAPEAAHWLSQFYLRSNQNEKAFVLADQWVEQTNDPVYKVQLMLDQADAAYASTSRRPESRQLYLKIADEFPKHRLAATALYNAAYAAMEMKQYDDAIKLSGRFREQFANSDYLPDVLEVEGDSFLLIDDAKSSEETFIELIDRFDSHPKSPAWKLRAGLARYMQKKYDEAVQWLTPVVDTLQKPEDKAEALHWIGSSHYQLGKAKEAVAKLRASIATSSTWRRADETMLTLSRALYLDGQSDEAKKTTRQLISQFSDSPLAAEANYRLGEFEYDAGNYPAAQKHYDCVVNDFPNSQFAPYSLYGIGWSQLQQKQVQQATAAFSQLVDSFPEHSLATQALIGRASSYRQSDKPEMAIKDLNQFLQSNPVEAKKVEALYELGLAQIAQKNWPDVVDTFTNLIDLAPDDSPLADRFNYELAWGLRSNGEEETAVKYFSAIAKNWPNSSLAAEANFHVAQDAYKRKDYKAAETGFKACIAGSTDGQIREKAIYKLAWTFYKRQEYENALATFRQQIKEFPAGNQLYADGLFMVSESLYENDRFKEALQEYRVAKPVIETSKTVLRNYRILTFLHGAQSANKSQEYEEAIKFASPLLEDEELESFIKQEAQMEIGDAHRGLKQFDKALAAYEQAARHPGRTGARSMTMMGEVLFDQKQFPDAINRFKLVLYGYGGTDAADDVKHWQAVAAYEAARCNMVQVSTTEQPRLKQKLVDESKKHFDYLIQNFPDHKLVQEAKRQLSELEALQ